MALSATKPGEHDAERIRLARGRIDWTRPGAVEAFNQLATTGSQDPAAYEALAAQYPLEYSGLKPVGDDKHNDFLLKLRKKYDKAAVAVRSGAEIGYPELPRVSTGSLSLDWMLGGGLPRGYAGQFKGGESKGKTFVAGKACESALKHGGRAMWARAEQFSRSWARTVGIAIPFGPEELATAESEEQQKAMLLYNQLHPEGSRFDLTEAETGNDLLQIVCEATKANIFDIIVVDSMAVLKRKRILEEKQVGFVEPGGESIMFNDFCGRLEASFNFVEARRGKTVDKAWICKSCGSTFSKKGDHEKCHVTGKKPSFEETVEIGQPVRTAVVLINQLRDQGIGSPFGAAPDAGGGRGMKHLKGYDVSFDASEPIFTSHGGRIIPCGIRVQAQTTKSKICPPYREAAFEMYYETVPGFCTAGEYNPLVDLVGCKWREGKESEKRLAGLAEKTGIVRIEPPYYWIGEQKFHGFDKFRNYLRENQAVVQAAQAEMLRWIQTGGI